MRPCFTPDTASVSSQSKLLVLAVLLGAALRFASPLNLVALRLGWSRCTSKSNALAPGRHCSPRQSILPLQAVVGAVTSSCVRCASEASVAIAQVPRAAVSLGLWWRLEGQRGSGFRAGA